VARERRHHRRPELDPRDLTANQGQRGEGVDPEDLRQPEGREARVSGYFTSEPGTVTATLPIGGDSAAANAREQEANSFAAELLLPAATLRADIEGDLDYEEDDRVRRLAERYQVSLQLLLRRLAALGLFAPSR